MLIRRELQTDHDAIDEVHRRAFAAADEATEPAEVSLVRTLRADPAWVPPLSLVAVDVDRIVGHVVATEGRIGTTVALGLGPIGVLPEFQGRGVGSALMHAVLAAADALEYPMVVLVGDVGYYRQFGFVEAASLGVSPPDPTWGKHFQVRTLASHRAEMRGEFEFAAPFQDL